MLLDKGDARDMSKKKKSVADRLTYAYIRKIKRWMFCPACQNGKMTINKKSTMWTCEECGYQLSADEFEDDYVFWFCDECKTFLNKQEGFNRGAVKHICTECGFAQLSKREEMPTLAEADLIKKAICSKFNGRKYSEYYTAEDAVDRYKLALLNAIVRNALEGEKAYIALKLAWVYRNMGDEAQEKRFIGEALKGFINAYQREGFPIFELQEEVVCYLIAALSYEMDNDQQAIKWLQIVLRNKEISHKLKDRCFELKQMVSAREREKKKAEAEQT